MAVIRVNKTKDFTVMSNEHFKEKEMSLKAKGLLSLMLSLPDEWDYSVSGLVTLSKDGKDSVMRALDELETLGYLKMTRKHDKNGRFAGYIYDVFEKPYAEKPYAENPHTEKPYTENPQQLNTNTLNTNVSKTKGINISNEFDILWKLYPRKIGKPKALKAYTKARKNGVSFDDVKKGIESYIADISAKKTATEYVKHGSTWFIGECWNDEYEKKTVSPYAHLKGGLNL